MVFGDKVVSLLLETITILIFGRKVKVKSVYIYDKMSYESNQESNL
jgi:hypothetical protein